MNTNGIKGDELWLKGVTDIDTVGWRTQGVLTLSGGDGHCLVSRRWSILSEWSIAETALMSFGLGFLINFTMLSPTWQTFTLSDHRSWSTGPASDAPGCSNTGLDQRSACDSHHHESLQRQWWRLLSVATSEHVAVRLWFEQTNGFCVRFKKCSSGWLNKIVSKRSCERKTCCFFVSFVHIFFYEMNLPLTPKSPKKSTPTVRLELRASGLDLLEVQRPIKNQGFRDRNNFDVCYVPSFFSGFFI